MTDSRLRVAVIAGCAVMTVITGWGAVNSHVRENGWTFILIGGFVAWSFVVAGLVAWNRRPDNRTGPLMTLVGIAWLFAGLTESPDDLSFTAGMILGSLWAPLLLHLLLAYPSGRVDRPRALGRRGRLHRHRRRPPAGGAVRPAAR